MINMEIARLAAVRRLRVAEPEDDEWRDRAVCSQSDPEIWFPQKGGSTRRPKSLCISCPVQQECLDYALTHDERFGVWGGYSERERRKLLKGEEVIQLQVQERRIQDALNRPFPHGEKGYQRGCRCVACREGAARVRKEQRARKRAQQRQHLSIVKDAG